MSASSIATSFADLKAANNDRPTAVGQVIGSSATSRKPKRPGRRRLLILCAIGALILAGATFWFIDNAGYESTDDATIESHVIQVSPKVSAHVKAVHFDDNYQVKRGDLLVELDPRDFEVSRAVAAATVASAQSKLSEAKAEQDVAQASVGQGRADLVSAQATAENAVADFQRNESL